jgi:hypothetical protein
VTVDLAIFGDAVRAVLDLEPLYTAAPKKKDVDRFAVHV